MKSDNVSSRFFLNDRWISVRHSGYAKSGSALLIAMASLVLMACVIMAFLSSSTNELRKANSYNTGSEVRGMADSALNLVIAQLRNATTDPDSGGPYSWVTQPGLVRSYNTNGECVKTYKLYSSDKMQVDGPNDFDVEGELANEVPGDWKTRRSEFVDLNAPVTIRINGIAKKIYPILDPTAPSDNPTSAQWNPNVTSSQCTSY